MLIKPNEGLRAVHDGERRLSDEFIINWHLNRGGSYSASYLLEAIALHLYLQEHAERVVLAGLSQGGQAALITALLGPEPDALVISSGYSVLSYSSTSPTAEWAGHNQIIVPGIAPLLAPERLAEELTFPTLFTYGREERGVYRVEAEERLTCRALEDVEDIACVVHDDGHSFPVPEIVAFLDDALA